MGDKEDSLFRSVSQIQGLKTRFRATKYVRHSGGSGRPGNWWNKLVVFSSARIHSDNLYSLLACLMQLLAQSKDINYLHPIALNMEAISAQGRR